MRPVISLLSVIPMRKEPSHSSEMVSQLLFGEYAEVLEEAGDFVKVRGLYDGYEGWVQTTQLQEVAEVLETETFVGHWSDKVALNDRYINVPLGTPVYGAGSAVLFGKAKAEYPLHAGGFWNSRSERFDAASLQKLYTLYLDTPYLWGGKSVFGIDCSGFVQQLFKFFGVKLLRDAYLQAGQGVQVESLPDSQLGDLAFFHNETGRITHVGVLLSRDQIVHAAGKVRLDLINDRGITHVESGKQTHQLHSIRRIL